MICPYKTWRRTMCTDVKKGRTSLWVGLCTIQRTTTRMEMGKRNGDVSVFAAKIKPPTFLFWSWLSKHWEAPRLGITAQRTANTGRMKPCSQSETTSYHPYQAWWYNVAYLPITWDPCNSGLLHTCIWINIMGLLNHLINPCNHVVFPLSLPVCTCHMNVCPY